MSKHFHSWENHKKEDIMTYRDKCFDSAITGHMAPLHHTKWFDALDDSIQAFIKTSVE
jgi:trimethylamine monooxygenase